SSPGKPRMSQAGERQGPGDACGNLICEMARGSALSLRVIALAVQKTSRGIGNRIAAFIGAIRARAAKRRHRHGHERWIDRAQFLIIESEFFQITERRRLDEKVGRSEQLRKNAPVAFALVEIENDTAFIR